MNILGDQQTDQGPTSQHQPRTGNTQRRPVAENNEAVTRNEKFQWSATSWWSEADKTHKFGEICFQINFSDKLVSDPFTYE